jgi:hypothetical protein
MTSVWEVALEPLHEDSPYRRLSSRVRWSFHRPALIGVRPRIINFLTVENGLSCCYLLDHLLAYPPVAEVTCLHIT